jgi:hypothetical protein
MARQFSGRVHAFMNETGSSKGGDAKNEKADLLNGADFDN